MKRFVFILLAFVLTLAACKKSVEGESSKFESNKAKLQELAVLYPAFEEMLNYKLMDAENLWEEASGISDEEKKIERMAEANAIFSDGVPGKLKAVDSDIANLERKISDMNRVAKTEIDRRSAASAMDGANMAINNANEILRNGAADETAALTVLTRASSQLDRSKKDCQRVITSAKAKKKKGSKTKNAKGGNNVVGGDTKTKDVATSWKCGYCGKKNSASATDCSGCGAQH